MNQRKNRLSKKYRNKGAGKVIVIAKKNINKGHILEDNDVEEYVVEEYDPFSARFGNSFTSNTVESHFRSMFNPVGNYGEKLRNNLLGLRAIVDIQVEEELKLTLFEDPELFIQREEIQSYKNKIKLQMKNNLWL